MYSRILLNRFVFNDENKHYPQVFLEDGIYKLA